MQYEIHVQASQQPRTTLQNKQKTQCAAENARLRWISRVDADCVDEDSLHIMKLSMRGELNETDCESIKSAADLFHALEKPYPNKDVQLARFICALEKLGHRKYGWRAIRKLEERYLPPPFDPHTRVADINNFVVHQKLAVLCCILPKDSYSKFITHCAKKCGCNPNKCKTPWGILVECLNRNILTYEDHLDQIEEALVAAGLSESEIQEHFKQYNKISKS